ncbi:MAG: hypothetical protein HY821_22930 [Acidobacteria bacterium]|nr:hypothetical protein [Acidobacteriota bacterium]
MPRTRWWWPGSRVTREGITAQLEQMRSNGIGGVEIVHVWRFYRSDNLEFLSPAWLDMVRHAVTEATRLDMKVALTTSPGWDFGGPWVPPDERSLCLAPCWLDLHGPFQYEGPLPVFRDFGTPHTGLFENLAPVEGNPAHHHSPIAVVGARLAGPQGEAIDASSLVDLTSEFVGEAGRWQVDEGRWRLFAFRLIYTGQQNSAQDSDPRSWVVDHLNRDAVLRCVRHVTRTYRQAFGPMLGRTIDSLFADSFEAVPLANTILWSTGTLAEFRLRLGYDLAPLLPALWFDIGPRTPQIRSDVNCFLHDIALDFCFQPFLEACREIGVRGRMQPHYRFHEEIIQGAGLAHVPETEVTTARFETVADPRKATVAGARFYGREVVSAEAYTFLHPYRYAYTLEEMKRATDAFLRDGVTRFYNHGFLYLTEPSVNPACDVPFAERINPWMPWWPHYKGLAAYVARCCALLRQGRFVADILLYSPQAQVWSERSIFNIEQRVMKYGDVPKTLLANGYDYDPVNDHLLQTRAQVSAGALEINGYRYRAIVLPRIRVMPSATRKVLSDFIAKGGLVLALDTAPAGLPAHIIDYGFQPNSFSPQEAPYRKTPPLRDGQRRLLAALKERIPPQFTIAGDLQSDGLTFQQRLCEDGAELFFVPNLQPEPARLPVTFRVRDKTPELWDPLTGSIRRTPWRSTPAGVEIALDLDPWNSIFVVFRASSARPPKPAARKLRQTISLSGPWTPELGDARRSGILTYTTMFDCPRRDAELDLGAVGCAAEVVLNGRSLGSRWMQPYRFSIPKSVLRKGRNQLEVLVATTLLPAVQALKEMPQSPDALPPRPAALTAWQRDRKAPLPLSGLAGPVTLKIF